ncbi:MAG: branched-chain amino acid aminotransferase [Bacteroidia bacterium]|nr:branched-chain amino acid aminotransferase [Bacteroidia bacterium]
MSAVSPYAIPIELTNKSRLGEIDLNHVPFGKFFGDHMFVAEYKDGAWHVKGISPFKNVSMSYSISAIHYGQSIFEGMKAYKNSKGEVFLFRPEMNARRMNIGAKRMAMPEVPEELFIEALKTLVWIDREWIPASEDGSLYIRPFLFATDEAIGVRPSSTYQFVIFTSPVGKYYNEPLNVLIETNYFRAVKGGVGYVKASGNYGRSLYPTCLAQEKGYHQVIWTDSETHQYVEESGTMNLMFVLDGKIITPAISDTILSGITRDSIITIARSWNIPVEERKISITEVLEGIEKGTLTEAFGCGTAATIAPIKRIGYQNKDYHISSDYGENSIALKLDRYLKQLRKGLIPDPFGWVHKINP